MTSADMATLKRLLKVDEGLRLLPYDDRTGQPLKRGEALQGVLTIGYGRAIGISGITQVEADQLLDNDIEKHVADLERVFPVVTELDPVRQIVLAAMCFNMGIKKLASFRRMWDRINRRDFTAAAIEMIESRWADQVKARATRLAEAMRSGELKS